MASVWAESPSVPGQAAGMSAAAASRSARIDKIQPAQASVFCCLGRFPPPISSLPVNHPWVAFCFHQQHSFVCRRKSAFVGCAPLVCHMPAATQKDLFRAVDDCVKAWPTGDYVHHVRMVKDNGPYEGTIFQVMFSIPVPTRPVPEHCAVATFTVKPPNPDDEDDDVFKISYTMETQHQKIPGHLPIRKQWLDAAVRRKQHIAAAS